MTFFGYGRKNVRYNQEHVDDLVETINHLQSVVDEAHAHVLENGEDIDQDYLLRVLARGRY